MNKNFIIAFTVISISFNLQAEIFCPSDDLDSLQVCSEITEPQNKTDCAAISSVQNLDGQQQVFTHLQQNQMLACSEDDIKKKYGEDYNKLKKSFKKQCKKKAKQYKKALLEHLVKNRKYLKALKILFKRKKYTLDKERDDVEVKIKSSLDELENKSSQELEAYLMDELEKEYPGLKSQAMKLMDNDSRFVDGFNVNENIPYRLILDEGSGDLCEMKLDDFPKRREITEPECRFCSGIDIKNSFVNDCSYMVGRGLSEKDVDKLLGIKESTRKNYCQKNMKESQHQTDLSQINEIGDEICQMAKRGKEPDFNIQTSRNLYPDKTPQLAQKRGEFIRSYLYDYIVKTCVLEKGSTPIKSRKHFDEFVKVGHPDYEGAKSGDYGPDPLAKGENAQNQEVLKLRQTLTKEKEDLFKKIALKRKEIETLKSNIKSYNSAVSNQRKYYISQKRKLEKETDLAEVRRIYSSNEDNSIMNITENVSHLYESLEHAETRISILQKEIKGLELQVQNYEKDGVDLIERKIKNLEAFYGEANSNAMEPQRREFWDKKLFDEFKMVKITGGVKEQTETLRDKYNISPKLDIMLNIAAQSKSVSCIVEPHNTKGLKLRGALKGVGLVFMGGITLAAGIGTGAVVLAIGIPNTIMSLLCTKNCGQGSESWRKYRMIGDMTKLKSKNTRRRIKRGVKDAVVSMTTLGGRLSLSAGKDYRFTNFDDFDKYMDEYSFSKDDIENLRGKNLTIAEVKDSEGNTQMLEIRDKYGALYETREYENGALIYVTRYNKDEDEVEYKEVE